MTLYEKKWRNVLAERRRRVELLRTAGADDVVAEKVWWILRRAIEETMGPGKPVPTQERMFVIAQAAHVLALLTCETCRKQEHDPGPSHDGLTSCGSGSIASGGKNAHCTCDTCY